MAIAIRSDAYANSTWVPHYGRDGCITCEEAQDIYFTLTEFLFLIPSLIFAGLTFYALYKARADSKSVRKARHGSKSTAR